MATVACRRIKAMSKIICSKCSAPQFSTRSRFCTGCGAQLPNRPSAFRRLFEMLRTGPAATHARPRFNIDGTPMHANGMFDIKGNFYGRMGFPKRSWGPPKRIFNVDGTPMTGRGMFDVKGKPYGMPSSMNRNRTGSSIHRPFGRKF
jgi:hypothetical protein